MSTGVLVDVLGDLYGGSSNTNTHNGTSSSSPSVASSGAVDNIKKYVLDICSGFVG